MRLSLRDRFSLSGRPIKRGTALVRVVGAAVLAMAVMIPVLAVGAGVADAQIDGDDFDSYIHIEVDMFISGEAYQSGYDNTWLHLGDGRGFDESGSSWFRVKIALNEQTGAVSILGSAHANGSWVLTHDVDQVPGCDDYDCWTLESDASIEQITSDELEVLTELFKPEVEARRVGEDWELTIETGHTLEDNPLTQRFRFTFPQEHDPTDPNPRPVEVDARYAGAVELSIDFSGVPLVRQFGSSYWSQVLRERWFTTDWSNPLKYIDEEAEPDGNGYVPGSGGGGGLFNGGGHPADGGHHGSNNGGWAPGTLADGSWFLDDGTMTNHPSHGMDNDPSGTIPIECELSDGSVLVLQLPVGSIGSGRDLIHICEFA